MMCMRPVQATATHTENDNGRGSTRTARHAESGKCAQSGKKGPWQRREKLKGGFFGLTVEKHLKVIKILHHLRRHDRFVDGRPRERTKATPVSDDIGHALNESTGCMHNSLLQTGMWAACVLHTSTCTWAKLHVNLIMMGHDEGLMMKG